MEAFGLLGRRLSHSLSPQIHALLGVTPYTLLEREPEMLDAFFAQRAFRGINVTIPYKKDVIPYCDALTPTAKTIGSVNTIVRRADGTLLGGNTDAFGFSYLVRRSGVDVKNKTVLVLGTGGASLTVRASLEQLGAAEILSVSRTGKINYKNVYDFSSADVIINTTPVGMYPNNSQRLLDLSRFGHLSGVLDLIYNPKLTPLLYDAKQAGIPYGDGLAMLVAQAWQSAKAFLAKDLPESEIVRVLGELTRVRENLVLIGMPGSGKSTLARLLGDALGRRVYDTDAMVEAADGRTIPEIFAQNGEAFFRSLESEACAEAGKQTGVVIATGGGAVLREENRYALRQNGRILRLVRPLDSLDTGGRPLSKNEDALRRLAEEREPIYAAMADAVVEVTPSAETTLQTILETIK